MAVYIGDGDRDLIRLIDPAPELITHLWMLMHADMQRTPRVRAFFDFVIAEIKTFRALPTGRDARARWLEWSLFITAELDSTLYVIRRHSALSTIYGEAPAAVDAAKTYFLQQLRHADESLRAGWSFIMGEEFTTADILLVTILTWAIMQDVSIHEGSMSRPSSGCSIRPMTCGALS